MMLWSRLLSGAGGALLAVALVAGGPVSADETIPRVKPTEGPLPLAGSFGFTSDAEKLRRSASGIACARPSVCLIAFDEGVEGRFARLTSDGYGPIGEPVRLLTSGKELDAEAVATDGAAYFVAGSHSVKRKSCEENPASRFVLKLPVDPATGLASGEAQAADLWSIMAADPVLKARLGKCLGARAPEKAPELKGERGLDIEGMAARDGRLLFGLRGSFGDATVKIVSVDAAGLFSGGGGRADLKLFDVDVGKGRGVRDMAAVADGVLLLAGPDDDFRDDDDPAEHGTPPSWRVLLWDGVKREPKALRELDLSDVKRRKDLSGCDDKKNRFGTTTAAKLEGMAVTAETPERYRIVVLSDGLCDGGPMWFEVSR